MGMVDPVAMDDIKLNELTISKVMFDWSVSDYSEDIPSSSELQTVFIQVVATCENHHILCWLVLSYW